MWPDFFKAWSPAAAKHRTFGPFGRLTIVDACKVPNKNFLAWAEMFEGQKVKCTFCQMFVEMHQDSYQHAVWIFPKIWEKMFENNWRASTKENEVDGTES